MQDNKEKIRMVRKKILSVILALSAGMVLCGAGWFESTRVVIDTENNHVYKYYTADEIISEFVKDYKAAKEIYQKEYVLLSGKVSEIGKDGKNIVLSGTTETGLTITCSCDKELRSLALSYESGDSVGLYGQLIVNGLKKEIRLNAEKIQPPPAVMSKDMYYLLDGASFNKANAKKVTLNSNRVEYYIPSSWNRVEHSILEEGLGSIEGYQYVLNQITGSSDSVPESLFVCYFDNKLQLADYLNDSDETELIEKAIVENILGDAGKFPSKKVKTYYGSEYTYYSGAYKNILEAGTGYHTEFVFQADGEEGIVLILYVYKNTKHISDIMFLTRFLKIGKD